MPARFQAGERGPYLKISEAGLIDPHCGSDVAGFWSKNFCNKAEILHLDNPLRLDLKVPRIVIANDPPVREAGSYLGIPALSGGRFVGFMIVAGAPGGYTPESVQTIKPVVDIYAGVIEYLRADAARAASEEMRSPAVEEAPVIVFNCDNDAGRSINYILGDAEAITGQCASYFSAGDARSYTSLIEDACREKVADVIARRVKDGKQYEVEYNILRADGSKRRIYERGFAKYDHEFKPGLHRRVCLGYYGIAGGRRRHRPVQKTVPGADRSADEKLPQPWRAGPAGGQGEIGIRFQYIARAANAHARHSQLLEDGHGG